MFFYLSKILFFLTTPVVWIFGLLIWGLLTKKPKRKEKKSKAKPEKKEKEITKKDSK